MAEGLFHLDNFYDIPVKTLFRYLQCCNNLIKQHLTTGCWATTKPTAKLMIIMERVNDIIQRPIGETAHFGLDITQRNGERRA